MTMLTINLPEDLVSRLRAEAAMRHVSLDLYMSELLTEKMSVSDMLDMSVSFDTVLAHVRNAPPRAANHIFPASVSLSDVLRTNIGESDSDETSWNREWTKAEAELKAIDAADQDRDQAK